mmetsp:Transcript_16850/g.39134  ORF Transcript_16850/g.39134 Transcript_16850/m.39134 type:complete len:220 (+) Transcript_16850:525-1184(+)
MSWHSSHLQVTLHPAALIEDGVMLSYNQVAVPDASCQPLLQIFHRTLLLEDFEGSIALVQTDRGKRLDLSLHAGVLKVYAVHLEKLHSVLLALCIFEVHLLTYPVCSLHPGWMKLTTMTTPICIEVDHSVRVISNSHLEVSMMEAVTGRGPVCLQGRLLFLCYFILLVCLLQDRYLFGGIGPSSRTTLSIHSRELERIRGCYLLTGKLVPHSYLQELTR